MMRCRTFLMRPPTTTAPQLPSSAVAVNAVTGSTFSTRVSTALSLLWRRSAAASESGGAENRNRWVTRAQVAALDRDRGTGGQSVALSCVTGSTVSVRLDRMRANQAPNIQCSASEGSPPQPTTIFISPSGGGATPPPTATDQGTAGKRKRWPKSIEDLASVAFYHVPAFTATPCAEPSPVELLSETSVTTSETHTKRFRCPIRVSGEPWPPVVVAQMEAGSHRWPPPPTVRVVIMKEQKASINGGSVPQQQQSESLSSLINDKAEVGDEMWVTPLEAEKFYGILFTEMELGALEKGDVSFSGSAGRHCWCASVPVWLTPSHMEPTFILRFCVRVIQSEDGSGDPTRSIVTRSTIEERCSSIHHSTVSGSGSAATSSECVMASALQKLSKLGGMVSMTSFLWGSLSSWTAAAHQNHNHNHHHRCCMGAITLARSCSVYGNAYNVSSVLAMGQHLVAQAVASTSMSSGDTLAVCATTWNAAVLQQMQRILCDAPYALHCWATREFLLTYAVTPSVPPLVLCYGKVKLYPVALTSIYSCTRCADGTHDNPEMSLLSAGASATLAGSNAVLHPLIAAVKESVTPCGAVARRSSEASEDATLFSSE